MIKINNIGLIKKNFKLDKFLPKNTILTILTTILMFYYYIIHNHVLSNLMNNLFDADWQRFQSDGSSLPDLLHKVDVPVLSNEDCSQLYGDEAIKATVICAGLLLGIFQFNQFNSIQIGFNELNFEFFFWKNGPYSFYVLTH